MTYFDSLKQTVRAEVETGRIGAPAFLRFSVQVASDCDKLRAALAEALSTTEVWLAASPKQLYTLGGLESGQITAVVKYRGGQSALVSVGLARKDSQQIDLMLVGSRGAIYHEGSIDQAYSRQETPSSLVHLMDAVDRSLETGELVSVEEGGE